jgi:hypothetical protein
MVALRRALTILATLVSVAALADDGSAEEPAPTARALHERLDYGLNIQRQMRGPVSAPWASAQGLAAVNAAPATVLVMGVSMRTGERSRLAWQTPLAVQSPVPGAVPLTRSEMQLAWTLRSRDPVASLRGSPFKYAFSGQTVVTLKPRRSKVSVTLQHQW